MTEEPTKEKLNRSVLIALDGSRSAQQAVNYAVHITGFIPGLEFVLIEVLPATPPYLAEEAKTDGKMLTKLTKFHEINRERAMLNLEKARAHLIQHGVTPERIRIKTRPRVSGLAQDILSEAEHGFYDALIIGRRGLTRSQEFFMGSVSSQLVQHAANVPLWIVDGQVKKPRIMVAVDGSPTSLRAVDHVAFMLGSNPEAEIDFLHVVPKFVEYCPIDLEDHEKHWTEVDQDLELLEEEFRRDEKICLDDFYNRAVKILNQAGFSKERIHIEERETSVSVAKTIVKSAEDLECGTIVIGRRGMGKSSFLGKVSDRVVKRVEGLAVWMVS